MAKYNKAMEDKDETALRDIIHDIKQDKSRKKDDVVKWFMKMMK